jgi:hypothetical protein
MTLNKWPLQVALRAYLLALSLSLGPSLIPVVTSYVRRTKARKHTGKALVQLLLNELGVNGFAFAVAVSFGGSVAIDRLLSRWAKQDASKNSCDQTNRGRFKLIFSLIHNLTAEQRTFISTLLSTSIGAALLHPRSKRHPSRPIHMPGPAPPSARLPPTLDLTLLLFTRACDVLFQTILLRSRSSTDQATGQVEDNNKRARSITSKLDAFLFWSSSARRVIPQMAILSLSLSSQNYVVLVLQTSSPSSFVRKVDSNLGQC